MTNTSIALNMIRGTYLVGTDYTVGTTTNSVAEVELLDFDIPANTVSNGIIVTFRAAMLGDEDSNDQETLRMKAGTNGSEATYATIIGIADPAPGGTEVGLLKINNMGVSASNENADLAWIEYTFAVDNLDWTAAQTVSITMQQTTGAADVDTGGAAHMLTVMGF